MSNDLVACYFMGLNDNDITTIQNSKAQSYLQDKFLFFSGETNDRSFPKFQRNSGIFNKK